MLALALMSSPAVAQQACGPWRIASAALARTYGEHPIEMGQAGSVILTVLANPTTGTFTIVAVRPDGIACLVASGLHWRTVKPGRPA